MQTNKEEYKSFYRDYNKPDQNYKIPLSTSPESMAYAKAIADKYLHIHNQNEWDGSVCKGAMLDLDLAPCIRGIWHQSEIAPHVYMKYEGGDMFKVCFIMPAFAYDKPSADSDSAERTKYILFPPKDNRVHSVLLNGVPSPNIGPFHGYNVICTYIHYFDYGFDAFCDTINLYLKTFKINKPLSEIELIYASLLMRIISIRSFYPVNSRPLPWNVAGRLLVNQIKKR